MQHQRQRPRNGSNTLPARSGPASPPSPPSSPPRSPPSSPPSAPPPPPSSASVNWIDEMYKFLKGPEILPQPDIGVDETEATRVLSEKVITFSRCISFNFRFLCSASFWWLSLAPRLRSIVTPAGQLIIMTAATANCVIEHGIWA